MSAPQVMNPNGRFGTTNLSALLSKSYQNRTDVENYGSLRWSGSWMDSGLDMGQPKEPKWGSTSCPVCFCTVPVSGVCCD